MRDPVGNPLARATVELKIADSQRAFTTTTDDRGAFTLSALPAGAYSVTVHWEKTDAALKEALPLQPGQKFQASLELTLHNDLLLHRMAEVEAGASGGEQLSSKTVTAIPLNKRDFSQLLLLAAGTMTDTNGAANFTQQFAVNGQRGTATVFAMDGIDTTDPELGGATFSTFNVDAIQEVNSSSGVMPAEIGHGAAGFTNIVTKSGANQMHGSMFEFVRNAAFDARNFFDRQSIANPGRIPPFVRNEFGLTNGGPVYIPGLYDGRNRTFYFGQYQGFRQVLGTTQVFSVPTPEEREGKNTTAFPGDTLYVPVDPRVAPVLKRYPFPNDAQGPFGAHTYATSSKVTTTYDQFSIRIDHRLSEKGQLFGRFSLNNVDGPLTNPSQTAVDPSFAIRFFDRQRNAGITYTRTFSPRLVSESSIGYVRATPNFPTSNFTQPALRFADGLYEPFNSAAGSVMGAFGNLFQLRQNISYIRGSHNFRAGVELRFNRDTTVFGISPNGDYTFGGGTAYSPVAIRSASGLHNIQPGDPLPDALSGFLTASPFSYSVAAAPAIFAQGEDIGSSAVRRNAYNFYFQDTWKASPRLSLAYGIRYEYNGRIYEAADRGTGLEFEGLAFSRPAPKQHYLVNRQPAYEPDYGGWGPRLALDWKLTDKTLFRAGASLSTILTNLWQNNFLTGASPFVVYLYESASKSAPVPFSNTAIRLDLPDVYTIDGKLMFPTGRSTDVPPNTEMDVQRFEQDIAARAPGNQILPMTAAAMANNFSNGYIGSYTASLEREIADLKVSAAYVATVGVKLAAVTFPNAYGGADPEFAAYTKYDSSGRVIGGYGPETLMNNHAHSTYHSLQTGISKSSERFGLGFQASYTFSKSLDNTSAVLGGYLPGSSGTVLQASPQNPFDTNAEKGPSTFDVTHVFSLNVIQDLPLHRVPGVRALGRKLTTGWQLLNVTTLTSGSPFSIYSGTQQTGVGANGADRPDQVGTPDLSTSRTVREDYFGEGANNASLFSIPIGVPGGTGPNQGRFGTLGRSTFRGPAYHNLDFALIKDTVFGQRGNAERITLQFRAEFFNIFNIVNFGLPANIVLGPGFGYINRTAGPSRQVQFSVKLLY